MGLVGHTFVGGTGALAVLLAAEAIAATAVVSEAALIYVAKMRNLAISILMIIVQAALSVAAVQAIRLLHPVEDAADDPIAAAGPAIALMIALGFASIAQSRVVSRTLGEPVSGWRWSLVWATAGAAIVGWLFTRLPHHL